MPARAPYPTPPARLPRWLAWLLPSLRGVESNPLFIKLSGQGFRAGRRRGFGLPREFRRPRGPVFTRRNLPGVAALAGGAFGCVGAPLLLATSNVIPDLLKVAVLIPALLFSVLAFILGAIATASMLVGKLTSPLERRFIANARQEPWGEDLALTNLSPLEIENAVVAARMIRAARLAAFMAVLGAALLLGDAWGSGNLRHLSGQDFLATLFWMMILGAIVCADLVNLAFLRLGVSIASFGQHSILGPYAGAEDDDPSFFEFAETALVFASLHLPGAVILGMAERRLAEVWELTRGPIENALPGYAIIAALLCLPACFCGAVFSRAYYRLSAGSFGVWVQHAVRTEAKVRPDPERRAGL